MSRANFSTPVRLGVSFNYIQESCVAFASRGQFAAQTD
jgi:hypothetical protein